MGVKKIIERLKRPGAGVVVVVLLIEAEAVATETRLKIAGRNFISIFFRPLRSFLLSLGLSLSCLILILPSNKFYPYFTFLV